MIVAGFGCRAGADVAALRAALALAAGDHTPDALAVPDDRLAIVTPLAEALGLPLFGIAPTALVAIDTTTQSFASLTARRVGSVAEAAALSAAGPGAYLLATRHISPDRSATCALAESLPR